MKRIIPVLIALLLVAGCNNDMEKTELTDWEFEYNDQWYSAKVPGCIHTDLMAHNLIPDPFYATNEDSVQWVGKRGWKYRTIITRDMWALNTATLCSMGPPTAMCGSAASRSAPNSKHG